MASGWWQKRQGEKPALNPKEGNKPRNQGQSIKAEVSNLVANEENMEEGKPARK
jgi:hypothetical protein